MQSSSLATNLDVGADDAKLTLEKFADGGIACLRFTGTIDESFEGKKLADTVRCETLLLDLGGVKKISSFGIREWVDFITAACKQAGAVVLIECGPKVVDQLNMVANFAGSGRVYSFYAPYRCDYCDAEHRVLMTADRDHETVRSMKPPTRPCPTCKDAMYFDEDPTSYFSYLLSQERFELSAEMEFFLASRLNYSVSDVARKLRVDKLIEGRLTYVRLAGDLDSGFPREKLADGLEGPVLVDVSAIGRIEPAGAAEWRGFVQMITPMIEQLYLVGVGPAFLEKLTRRDDLGAKGLVLTIALPYQCQACETHSTFAIDVELAYDVLKLAQAPGYRCGHCKAPLTCAASEAVLAALPGLPRPTVGAELKRVAAELTTRKLEKKKNAPAAAALAALAAGPPQAARGGGLATGVVSALVALVLVGGGFAGYRLWMERRAPDLGKITATSEPTRPSWVVIGAAGAGSCAEAEAGLSCVGASAFSPVQDDAIEEARDVALEAIAGAVAQRIDSPTWRAAAPLWEAARVAKLGALESNPTSSQARREVRQSRQAVARMLLATSAGAISPSPTNRYWEERTSRDGKQYVAYARFTVPRAALDRMIAEYAKEAKALGATVVGVFPLLGWRYPEVKDGAIVVALEGGRLKELGVAGQFVMLEVGGRKITGPESFASLLPEEISRLQSSGGTLELMVQAGDGAPRAFKDQIVRKAAPGSAARPGQGRKPVNNININVWDKTAGRGAGRDDPTQ
ncbi:MAG: hypothetical protein R3B48_25325 [Kofleriaceae bacterium]